MANIYSFTIKGFLSGWWLGSNDQRETEAIVSIERWDLELRAAGFSGLEAAVRDDDNEICCSMAHLTAVNPPVDTSHKLLNSSKKEVVLLYHKVRSSFVSELADILANGGVYVQWCELDNFETSLSATPGREVVSTLELEGPFLHNMDRHDFATFHALLESVNNKGGGGLLWLTRSASVNCTDPAYGMVLGLARTARIESSMDFWTVELSQLSSGTASAAASVARKFLDRSPDARRTIDCEYVIRDDIVYVGRYNWSTMQKTSEAALDNSCPKRLMIGRPGLLDTLHWAEGKHAEPGPDEVEIEIRCTALNFRVSLMVFALMTTTISVLTQS